MLADSWTSLTASTGEYESRGEPTVVGKRGGLTVIDTPMHFERTEMKSRVTFRADGTIAGLFILRKDIPPP